MVTDRYAKLRASLDHLENLDHTGVISSWVSQAPEVRALLADYDEAERALILAGKVNKDLMDTMLELIAERDKLREAAQMLADWAEDEVGVARSLTPGLTEIRAVLGQEQGESDDNS